MLIDCNDYILIICIVHPVYSKHVAERHMQFSVPKLNFGLGVRGENYPPKRGKEIGELLVGIDPKRVSFILGCRVYGAKRSIHTTTFST